MLVMTATSEFFGVVKFIFLLLVSAISVLITYLVLKL